MMLDPKWLEQTVAKSRGAGGAVGKPAPCRRCGYDLKGLPPGALCPECGTAVALSDGGRPATGVRRLMLAPMAQLERLELIGWGIGWGFFLLAAGMLGAWVLAALREMGWLDTPREPQTLLTAVAFVGALGWAGAAWMVCSTPLVSSGGEPSGYELTFVPHRLMKLRWVARLTQVFWPVGIGCILASTWQGGFSSGLGFLLALAAAACVAIGSLGMAVYALILHEVAQTTADDFAMGVMLWAWWAMPIWGFFCAMSVFVAGLLNQFMGFWNILGMGYTFVVMVFPSVMCAACLSLGSTCRWARRNAQQQIDREDEFRRKSQEAGRAERERQQRDGV